MSSNQVAESGEPVGPKALPDPITDWVRLATRMHGYEVEEWLRLYIRPQPSWLPRRTWEWLIRRAILMDVSTTPMGKSAHSSPEEMPAE